MASLLNRIETEYILNFFKTEKPDLNILQDDNFFHINKDEYTLNEKAVFLKCKNIETQHKILLQIETKFFFNYKDRPFYFFAKIKKNKDFFLFDLPKEIYKHQEIREDTNMFFRLETSNGLKMQATPESSFDLKYNHKKIKQKAKANPEFSNEILEIKNRILTMIKSEKAFFSEKISSAAILKIYEMLKFDSKIKINTSLIFIDSKFILLFCSQKNADIILKSPSIKAEITFDDRKIKVSLSYNFFYEIENKNITFFTDKAKQIKTDFAGVLCLSMKKIHEEDCRFLHEFSYGSKYGLF